MVKSPQETEHGNTFLKSFKHRKKGTGLNACPLFLFIQIYFAFLTAKMKVLRSLVQFFLHFFLADDSLDV